MSAKQEDKAPQIKLIVTGSINVGKTCLITHYQSGKFLDETESTCGSSYVQVKRTVNGNVYNVNLWDTAGQEKYNSLTKIFSKNTNILIMVYSIIDKKSFDDLDKWLSLVKETNEESALTIGIAANKADLYKESVVSDSDGQEYAKKIGAIWKSTSAKDGRGIEELIGELLKKHVDKSQNSQNKNFIQLDEKAINQEGGKGGGCCKGKGKAKNAN